MGALRVRSDGRRWLSTAVVLFVLVLLVTLLSQAGAADDPDQIVPLRTSKGENHEDLT